MTLSPIRSYYDRESAFGLCAELLQHDIAAEVRETATNFVNVVALRDEHSVQFAVFVPETVREQALALLHEQDLAALQALPADHYLHTFSEDELREIVTHANEWSELDVLYASQKLNEAPQNAPVEPAGNLPFLLRDPHPEAGQRVVVNGYVSALLGQDAGIAKGLRLAHGEPRDGQQPSGLAGLRRQGVILLFLSILAGIVWASLKQLYLGQ